MGYVSSFQQTNLTKLGPQQERYFTMNHSSTVPCQVKSITAIFDDSSVYGSRESVYPCLLVTANEKHNIYHKTKCWKQASIKGISMLPRSDMMKVDRNDSFFAGNDRFTRVQELKQAVFDKTYQTIFSWNVF